MTEHKPIMAIAKTHPGKEFLYDYRTAHKVSKASAAYICEIANKYKYKLKDGECWHVYEIGYYDAAYDYAEYQYCTVRKGIVKAHSEFC